MRNLGPLASTFAVFSVAFSLTLLLQKPVHAQSDAGALVLHDCPNTTTTDGQSDGYKYEVCADIAFTTSGEVNATFHGQLLDPATAPSQPVIVRDFPCEYNGEIANNSEVIITPDGNVNGRCELHTN